MDVEPLTRVHRHRDRVRQGDKLVSLSRTQRGLRHTNCKHNPAPRAHYGRLRRLADPPVDPLSTTAEY